MSFYSLLVRDQKRGWILGAGSTEKKEIVNHADALEQKTQIIRTDGNTRNIERALEAVRSVNGKGFGKIVGFQYL